MRCLLLLGLLVPGVASAAVPGAGQLVITEIMADAS